MDVFVSIQFYLARGDISTSFKFPAMATMILVCIYL